MSPLIQTTTPDVLDTFTSLGTAGVMAAMWLWERRTSRLREQQLDEAHARIMSDRVAISELIDVVRQNAEALSRMLAGCPVATNASAAAKTKTPPAAEPENKP